MPVPLNEVIELGIHSQCFTTATNGYACYIVEAQKAACLSMPGV